MRQLALTLLVFCTPLVNAFPVTYIFSGELTRSQMAIVTSGTGQSTPWEDVSTPLIVNGETLLTGSTMMVGSITIDHELILDRPGFPPSNYYGGQILDYQITFGGEVFYPRDPGSVTSLLLGYMPGAVRMSDEISESTKLNADVLVLDFNFDPGTFWDSSPDVLPVDQFLGGAFRMTSVYSYYEAGQDYARGNLFGTITSLYRVEVPEPGTLGLLAAGLLGVVITRRRGSSSGGARGGQSMAVIDG